MAAAFNLDAHGISVHEIHRNAGASQRHPRRQPTDAAARDEHPHGRLPRVRGSRRSSAVRSTCTCASRVATPWSPPTSSPK